MFEVQGVVYTLKFNQQKVKTVEMVAKRSIVSELVNNNGILPYNLLELLFTMALVEEKTNEAVPQKKATEMFEKVVEENGYLTTNEAVVEKFYNDMGFLFR